MKFSRTERGLQAVAVVAIAVLILIILCGQIVKGSGPAEWLSALLNLVMAGAAVAAFITARSWLPQLTTQEGYKLAIRLVNDEFIWMGIQNPLLHEAGSLCAAAREAFTKKSRRGAGDRLSQAIARLENVIKESKQRQDTIAMAMFRMQTYGLQVADDRAASMSTMLRGHADSLSYTAALLAPIRSYHNDRLKRMTTPISHSHPEQNTWLDKVAIRDAAVIQEAEAHLQELRTVWHQMVKGHEKMIGSDHRIGKLFVVRKG